MRSLLLSVCFSLVVAGCVAEDAPPTPNPDAEPIGLSGVALPLSRVDHRVLPKVDVDALVAEDDANLGRAGVPYRVAEPIVTGFALENSGTTEILPDGGTLWRLRVSSLDSVFVSFTASSFWLPPGARLFFYSVERDYLAGPYTQANNNASGTFASPAIPTGVDGSAVIELYTPPGSPSAALTIDTVSHGYRDFRRFSRIPFRDGSSLIVLALDTSCEVDINCAEGADWQSEKNAVAETYDGRYVCSGTLLNNTSGDCRNFFLTANHCVKRKRQANTLVFYWNYENATCGGSGAPTDRTSIGSTLRATNSASDFTLLELSSDPDAAYEVYHAGWNRSSDAPSSAVAIHHPNDLPKKISFENDPLEDGGDYSDGWGDTHWRVTGWDVGTTEPGSSGCGLFNASHQVVGQLTGGTGDCGGGWDEFGKLSESWSRGLSQWLDPNGTGAMSVDGQTCTGGGEPPPPPPPPTCELGEVGDACVANADCCSNRCKGKRGAKTCK